MTRKEAVFILAIFAAVLIVIACMVGVKSCHAQGVERWPVKVLSDGLTPGAPARSTIHAERLLKAQKWREKLPRQPLETVTVKISGEIIACGVEADEDYHLDFSDGNETMVCEIPNPKMNPEYAEAWQAAREWVAEHVGFTPGKIRKLKHPVACTITGVQFFDKPAHGLGGSPNGIEIHPCLKIE